MKMVLVSPKYRGLGFRALQSLKQDLYEDVVKYEKEGNKEEYYQCLGEIALVNNEIEHIAQYGG